MRRRHPFQLVLTHTAPFARTRRSGAYAAALADHHQLADTKQPLEILRTIHSCDPCIACAVHLADPATGERLDIKVT